MKAIKVLNFSKVQNAEHYQFHEDVLNYITTDFATAQGIEAQRTAYADLFATESDIFQQNQAYAATKQIEEADKLRDDLFLYLKESIVAAQRHPIAAKKEAADKLAFVFKPYANANTLAYNKNTAEITNLITDLCAGANLGYLQQLGLTDGVDALEQANEAFKELYRGRSDEKNARSTTEKMRDIRPQVDDAYRQCVAVINALYLVNDSITKDAEKEAALGTVIDHVNGVIIQLQETIALRIAKAKEEEEDSAADKKV